MEIYFLRHAIAVERGTKGYADDSSRPLTLAGTNKMRQNALGMKALGLSFDLILSSPYIRAKQTAEIVVQVFKKTGSPVLTKNLIPSASFKDLLGEINAPGKKITRVLLVGHEPHLSELVSFLLIKSRSSFVTLKKGGLCYLHSQGTVKEGSATLEWLLTPMQLRRICQK